MTIYNWQSQRLPRAKAFDANGKELRGRIYEISTATGHYESYKLDANGQVIIEHDDTVTDYGHAIPPITIKWSENRILFRMKMAWYVFEFKVSCWWTTGRWPKKSKSQRFIKD